MAKPPSRPFIAAALLIAILAVSTASIFIRFAQKDAPSLVIAALRLTFATLMLAPIALTRYRSELSALTTRELVLGVVSGLFLGVHFATWISSLAFTTVANSVVLVSTGPLWVALVSPLFLNERLSRSAFLGLGLALIGGTLIALSGGCVWDHGLVCAGLGQVLAGRGLQGDLLALAGAWAVTGYLIIGRRLRAKINLVPYIFLVYGVAAISLLLSLWVFGMSPLGYRPITYLWLVLLALIPQLVGHSTYNWSLKFLPAAIVAVATLGEPIGSATLAYFILHETPAPSALLGGAMILAGIYIAVRSPGKCDGEQGVGMEGLSPRTWQLVRRIFPGEAEVIGRLLITECGQNLPFCQDYDEFQLERLRFAALKISGGHLERLKQAIEQAQRDWRDELMWAGFGERLTAHDDWAKEILNQE